MKKILFNKIKLLSFLVFSFTLSLSSCKKDSDGSPDVKAGIPVFESITPNTAAGGSLITLKGSGLGDMKSIVFDKDSIHTYLMSTLNTETVILFRVPGDAIGGPQNIVFVNSEGKTLKVPFNVEAFPQVNSVSNYDFVTGSQITLTGTNLNDVTDVTLTGTSDHASIVSATRTTLVIAMPSTAVSRATLDVTNVSGKITTSAEFVSITNNFIVYADAYGTGAFNGGVQSWSYGCNVSESTQEFKTGTKSLKVDYADGGLSLWLGSDTWSDGHWFTDFFHPTYITFWAKGAGKDVSIIIKGDGPPNAPPDSKTVSVPADVWTYFKIPANFIPGSYGRLNFIISGTTGRTVYYDDILYVK
jgi:hypothetical protein